MDWKYKLKNKFSSWRNRKTTPLRESCSSPDIAFTAKQSQRSGSGTIGEKLNDYNGRSDLDLSSLLSVAEETENESDHARSETTHRHERRDGTVDEVGREVHSSTASSVAEDPSERSPDSVDESIHPGHTEPTSLLLKRGFSAHLMSQSFGSLTTLGTGDDQRDRQSSLGYGTNDSGAEGRTSEVENFRGSVPDWRGMFGARIPKSPGSTKEDDTANDELSPAVSQKSPTGHTFHIYSSNVSIQANQDMGAGTDDSRLSCHGSRPCMVTVNGSNRQKSISERTECLLESFESEKLCVRTRATCTAIEKLTREQGDHVAVIVGQKYDGKRFCARGTLAGLTETWQVAEINSPEEMDEICSRDNVRTCFCIVDIFGKGEFQLSSLEKWQPRFDEMLSKAKSWKIGLVITMNKRVYDKYCTNHDCHDLFDNKDNIIDLTSDCSHTKDDKRGILKCHLQQFPCQRVLFTPERTEDNVDTFKMEGDLRIWDGYLDEIVASPSGYGFPKQAEIYSSKLEYIQMRCDFFKRPLKFHCLSVKNIRESHESADKESAFAIESVLAGKGRIDITRLEEKYSKSMRQKVKLGRKKRTPVSSAIMEHITRSMPSAADAVTVFNRGKVNVNQWLLVQEGTDEIVKFSCPANHHAAALVVGYSKQFEADVIKCAPRYFIYNCVRPYEEKYRGVEYLLVHQSPKDSTVKDELYCRLAVDAITHRKIADVCNHQLLTKKWFGASFLDYLKNNGTIDKFTTTLDVCTGMNALYHGMDVQYTDAGVKETQNLSEDLFQSACWKSLKTDPQKRKQEKESLHKACKLGLCSTFSRLRKNLDSTCLKLAVEAGSAEIVEDILRDKRSFKSSDRQEFSDLSDILEKACRTHCKSNGVVGLKIAKLLIDNNCSIDRKDSEHDPLIHNAVRENDTALLDLILKLDCDLNIMDRKGNRPLHTCVLSDSKECADALLKNGADKAKLNRNKQTPLHLAVTSGSLNMVHTLVALWNGIHTCDGKGRTALHLVLQLGRSIDMLNSLLSAGADASKADGDGHLPLYYAIASKNLPATKRLVWAGASANQTDRNMKTMFEISVSTGCKQITEYLLEKSLECPIDVSEIPFAVIDSGEKSFVQTILRSKCKLSCTNKLGDTLLKYAIEKDNLDAVSLLCETDSSLINLACKGVLPLHTAISSRKTSFEICNFLVASGASISSRTNTGDTPLHLACMHGRLDVIQLLLELDKALPGEHNDSGMTPLHMAAEHGHLTVVQILLIMEADPCSKSKQPHQTPLDLALYKRNIFNDHGDIGQVRTYDQIIAELRREMYGKRRYASTIELGRM